MTDRLYTLSNMETGEVVQWTAREVDRVIRCNCPADVMVVDWVVGLEQLTNWRLIHEDSCKDCVYQGNCEVRGDLTTWCEAYHMVAYH